MSDNAAPVTSSESTEGGGDGAAAPVVDYGEILAQHQSELARTGKTVETLRAELDKSHGVIGRVQKAFSGEEEKKLTPSQARMRELDALTAYLDEESGGRYPMTEKVGKQLAAFGKEAEARADKLEHELSQLKEAMKRQQNPAFQGLERAAFIMEGMVDEGLESLYGADAGSKSIRSAQFNAVTARINDEIKDLMKNDPEALLKVQRNPKIMRKMVNHFMAEMLPPKVRGMLDDERIQNEVMSVQDLYQAFAQARDGWQEAQAKGDERAEAHFSGLMTDLRHDILGHQYGGRRGGTPERPSLNQLFASGR